jgi:hypothetical protein
MYWFWSKLGQDMKYGIQFTHLEGYAVLKYILQKKIQILYFMRCKCIFICGNTNMRFIFHLRTWKSASGYLLLLVLSTGWGRVFFFANVVLHKLMVDCALNTCAAWPLNQSSRKHSRTIDESLSARSKIRSSWPPSRVGRWPQFSHFFIPQSFMFAVAGAFALIIVKERIGCPF